MKIDKFLPKSIKKYFRRKVGEEGPRPDRDWKVMFIVAAVMIIIGALFCGNLLFRVESGTIFNVAPSVETQNNTINESELTQTVSRFEQKKADAQILQSEKTTIPDPSL